jgi:hypothetical protein
MNYLDKLIEDIKTIDEKSTSNMVDNKPTTKIIESQKIYIWIRVYLKEEVDVIEGDEYKMEYIPSGENLMTKFVSFGKKNLNKNHQDQIINFDPEVDKKILCLMVDENEINTKKDIPFIRTLFKTSRFYDYQVIRRSDLTFTNQRNGECPEYIDCDF